METKIFTVTDTRFVAMMSVGTMGLPTEELLLRTYRMLVKNENIPSRNPIIEKIFSNLKEDLLKANISPSDNTPSLKSKKLYEHITNIYLLAPEGNASYFKQNRTPEKRVRYNALSPEDQKIYDARTNRIFTKLRGEPVHPYDPDVYHVLYLPEDELIPTMPKLNMKNLKKSKRESEKKETEREEVLEIAHEEAEKRKQQEWKLTQNEAKEATAPVISRDNDAIDEEIANSKSTIISSDEELEELCDDLNGTREMLLTPKIDLKEFKRLLACYAASLSHGEMQYNTMLRLITEQLPSSKDPSNRANERLSLIAQLDYKTMMDGLQSGEIIMF